MRETVIPINVLDTHTVTDTGTFERQESERSESLNGTKPQITEQTESSNRKRLFVG